MKKIVHITYETSRQTSEDTWQAYTEVIDIKPTDTIEDIIKKHFKGWQKIDVQLHIRDEE